LLQQTALVQKAIQIVVAHGSRAGADGASKQGAEAEKSHALA
jgi:hypothetical protein